MKARCTLRAVPSLTNVQPSQKLGAALPRKDRPIYRAALIWKTVCLEVLSKLLENKFSCAFSSQKTQKKILLPKTREKLLSFLSNIWGVFFDKTFHPIKSYFLSKVLMIKCSCTLFNGRFHSITYHLLHCKRFFPMKTKYINTEMQISCQQVLLQRLGTICMGGGC